MPLLSDQQQVTIYSSDHLPFFCQRSKNLGKAAQQSQRQHYAAGSMRFLAM
jgi:hypothetical protein